MAVPLLGSLLIVTAVAAALLIRYWHAHAASPSASPPLAEAPLDWRTAALLLTAVFVAANQLLVRGVGVGIWDVFSQFYPYFVFVADHVRAGRLVGWDPWTNGGLPLLGDPQVGAFSPVVNVLGLLFGGTSGGFRAYWLLSWWLGGVGMLFLARHLGSPLWGACVISLGFLFCGVYVGNAEHTPWISAYSFLPFIVWRFDVALQSGRFFPAVEAGALWGLSALAGYPGVVVITGCFVALWSIGRLAFGGDTSAGPTHNHVPRQERTRMGAARAVAALALVGVTGSVILSPTYLSFFYEGAGMNPRAGTVTREMALVNAFDPGAIVSLFSPYLPTLKLGHPELWPASDVSMVSVYAGPLVVVLALYAFLSGSRTAWRWWMLCLAGLSLAAAVGEALPIRGWLYDWVYPTRFFRHPAIFRLYFIFSVCLLAAAGASDLADALRRDLPARRRRLLWATLLAAATALAAATPYFGSGWEAGLPRSAVLLGRTHFFVVWALALLIALLIHLRPLAAKTYPVAILLIALASGDAIVTSTVSIPTVLRFGSLRGEWLRLEARHSPSLDLTGRGLDRAASACPGQSPESRCGRNDQLITKVPVLDAYASERNELQTATVRDPVLRATATGPDRVWFAQQTLAVAPTAEAFASFAAHVGAHGRLLIVTHEPAQLLARAREEQRVGRTAVPPGDEIERQSAVPVQVSVRTYSPNVLKFDVEVPTDGSLLVTDRWARGWRLRVNGMSQPLHGANFIFRAVPVTAGRNRIEFTFHPRFVPWLVVVSWGCLAAVAAGSGSRAVRRRRRAEHGLRRGGSG